MQSARYLTTQIMGGTAVRETGDGTNFAYLPGRRWEIRKYWDISQVGDGRRVLSSGDRRLYHTPKGDGRKAKKTEWETGGDCFCLQKLFFKRM